MPTSLLAFGLSLFLILEEEFYPVRRGCFLVPYPYLFPFCWNECSPPIGIWHCGRYWSGGGLYEDDADGRNALMAWAADCRPSVCLAIYIGDEASLQLIATCGTICWDDGT